MALKHTKVSAVADDGDATKVQPSDWNADHEIDGDGVLIAADATTPSSPASSKVTMFGKTLAGRNMLASLGPAGADTVLQAHMGRNKIGWWNSTGNSSSTPINSMGMVVPTFVGTATTRNVANTSFFTMLRRTGVVSATSAGSSSRTSNGQLQFMRGDAAGKGGFFAIFRFGCSDAATVTGARSFVGFAASSIGNVDPSTILNMIGVGTDAGEANLSIMHNDGSGAATKVALGANFPDHTLSVDAYELVLFCAPNTSTVGYQVTRLNTGDVASGSISTDLPSTTTLMLPQFLRNNGATALAVGQDVISFYVETEN